MKLRRRRAGEKAQAGWSRTLWPAEVAGPVEPRGVPSRKTRNFLARWGRRMINVFSPTPVWEKEEALMTLLVAAAWADRSLSKEEEGELASLAARTPTLAVVAAQRKAAIMTQARRNLEVDFESTVETACASLPPEMRISAFSHCVDIVYADRAILPLEARFLNKLIELLSISEDKARSIAAAMAEKNAY